MGFSSQIWVQSLCHLAEPHDCASQLSFTETPSPLWSEGGLQYGTMDSCAAQVTWTAVAHHGQQPALVMCQLQETRAFPLIYITGSNVYAQSGFRSSMGEPLKACRTEMAAW